MFNRCAIRAMRLFVIHSIRFFPKLYLTPWQPSKRIFAVFTRHRIGWGDTGRGVKDLELVVLLDDVCSAAGLSRVLSMAPSKV
jgi:hypothetical protein